MTPYQKHREDWKDCQRCLLSSVRQRVIFARGKLPAEVLFIGEAPGDSEDALGSPFVGPAGKVLDGIIEAANVTRLRYALTNLVGCVPDKSTGNHAPPKEAIEACAPRLVEIYQIAHPRLVVAVGDLAKTWVPKIIGQTELPIASITHPAAILRADITRRGVMYQQCVVSLRDATEDL